MALLAALWTALLFTDVPLWLGHSRDVWSDEGLYALQARNVAIGLGWDVGLTDGALKSPLWTAWLIPWLSMWPTLTMVRIAAVVLHVVFAFFLLRANRYWVWVLLISGDVFCYLHSGLPEFTALLAGALSVIAWHEGKFKFALFWMLVAVGLKTSLFYLAALPLLTCIWPDNRVRWKHAIAVLAIPFLLGGLLFAMSPENFRHIYAQQGAERWGGLEWIPRQMLAFTRNPLHWWLIFPLGWVILNLRAWWRQPWILTGICWIILECHKWIYSYYPERYQVGLVLALSFTFLEAARHTPVNRWIGPVAGGVLGLFFLTQTAFVPQHDGAIRRHVSNSLSEGDTVWGSWGASMAFDARARIFPIWKGYWNEDLVKSGQHPSLLIAEPNEAESEGVYQKNGLEKSVQGGQHVTVHYGWWSVGLYYREAGRYK